MTLLKKVIAINYIFFQFNLQGNSLRFKNYKQKINFKTNLKMSVWIKIKNFGATELRSPRLVHAKHALYQMSYNPFLIYKVRLEQISFIEKVVN